jgi:hypothetical protein
MKSALWKVMAALAVLANLAGGAVSARAQDSVSRTTERIPRPNTGRQYRIPFDDTTVRTLRATSDDFDPVIVVVYSDGTRRRYTGVRGGRPAEVRLLGNPGSLGWVDVIIGGNGVGQFTFEYDQRPNRAAPPPPPPPPGPRPAPGPLPVGVNLQAKLEWHDRVDLDLWVTEPTGRVINYRNKNLDGRSGAGSLDMDNQQGGPNSHEMYNVRNGPRGDYQFQVKLFSDGRTAAQGKGQPVRCTVTFFRDGVQVGQPREITLSSDANSGFRSESNIITP